MKHPIKTIPTKSTIVDELREIARASGPWVPYYNFLARPVSYDILFKDPFFQWLGARYNFMGGIIKMEPYQQYDWHVDTRRGVGINMLLGHTKSYVLFTERPTDLVKNIRPHKYQENIYYVFNTQVPHSVVNLSGQRYLFTIEFEKDKTELTFEMLWKDILENYVKAGENNE